MKRIPMAFLATLFFISPFSSAWEDTAFTDKTLCAKNNAICIKGTLHYDPDRGSLRLSGRITKPSKPGTVKIKLVGAKDSKRHTVTLKQAISGQYSDIVEIVSLKAPKGQRFIKWQVKSVTFK